MPEVAEEQNRATEEEARPPTLWTELQQAIAKERTPAVDLWAVVQQRSDPSLKEPRREAGVEVSAHRSHSAQGAAYCVLTPSLHGGGNETQCLNWQK
jgi:hypothetical protein